MKRRNGKLVYYLAEYFCEAIFKKIGRNNLTNNLYLDITKAYNFIILYDCYVRSILNLNLFPKLLISCRSAKQCFQSVGIDTRLHRCLGNAFHQCTRALLCDIDLNIVVSGISFCLKHG